MLLLALKKVQMVKITPRQILTTREKNPHSSSNTLPPTPPRPTPQHTHTKFLIATTEWDPLSCNAISKTLNCPFTPKEDLGENWVTSALLCLSVFSHHAKVFQKSS